MRADAATFALDRTAISRPASGPSGRTLDLLHLIREATKRE